MDRTRNAQPRRHPLDGRGPVLPTRLLLVAVWLSATADELTWLWSNPLPHGNNVYDLAVANGHAIQVGDRGRIYTSLDFELWVPRESGTAKALRSVALLGNRVVITGEAGTVVYGDGPAAGSFTALSLGTTDWLEGVAASPTRAVAVGDNGAVYVSADGAAWSRQPQPFSTWLRSVAYGDGVFVAVGEDGFLATSPDGVKWQARDSGTSAHLNRVVWMGEGFVAAGDQGALRFSATGINAWRGFPNAPPMGNLYALAGLTQNGAPSLLVAAGDGELRLMLGTGGGTGVWSDQTSPDRTYPAPAWAYYGAAWDGAAFLVAGRTGMTVEGFQTNGSSGFVWIDRADAVRPWLWDVQRLSDRYVAVGDFGTVISSRDGVTWALDAVPTAATNHVLYSVGAFGDRAIAVGSQGSILTSTDGVTWEAAANQPVTYDLQGIAVSNGRCYVTGAAGTLLSSADGLTWRVESTLTAASLSGLAAFPGGLVACGDGGALFTSPDGTRWTAVPTGTTNWLYRVRYLNGLLLVLGENGTLLTSPDGARWKSQVSGTARWLNDVAFFNDRYYAVGTQGTLLTSSNAVDWQPASLPTQKSLYAAATTPRQLLVVGVEGLILRAHTGPLCFVDYRHHGGTNSFALSGRPGRSVHLLSSQDLSTWTTNVTATFLDNSGLLYHEQAPTGSPHRETFTARELGAP